MVVPYQTRELILTLLRLGGKYRGIARRVGVSRGTVAALAKRGCIEIDLEMMTKGKEKEEGDLETCAPYQCPLCNYQVCYFPCLICKARAFRQKNVCTHNPEGSPRLDKEPVLEEIKERANTVKAKNLERERRVPDRWHPPTFATPVYSLSGIED